MLSCKRIMILFVIFMVIPINLLSSDGSVNKINRLEDRKKKLTDELDKILLNSKKAKVISEKYQKITKEYLKNVTLFTEQKSECTKIEDIYKKTRAKKNLDKRAIKKQDENILNCYRTLEILVYNFEDMSKEFERMKKSMNILNDMLETDKASTHSFQKQLKVINSLIKIENFKMNSSKKEVKK